MTTDDNIRLAAIRERADNATRGPWEIYSEHDDDPMIRTVWQDAQLHNQIKLPWIAVPVDPQRWPWAHWRKVDAEFIAESRQDIPYLLALVTQLQADLERLKPVIEQAIKVNYDYNLNNNIYSAAAYRTLEKLFEMVGGWEDWDDVLAAEREADHAD